MEQVALPFVDVDAAHAVRQIVSSKQETYVVRSTLRATDTDVGHC